MSCPDCGSMNLTCEDDDLVDELRCLDCGAILGTDEVGAAFYGDGDL